MDPDVDWILTDAVKRGASDVHFTVGLPVQIRIEGQWLGYDTRILKPPLTDAVARKLASPAQVTSFEQNRECDLSYSIPGLGRFRVNLFYQRGSIGVAIRILPYKVPTFEVLGLPAEAMSKLCEVSNGLVLVCGPTGSGKSTTLAAMISHINRSRKRHIVTMEDPIEFLHEHVQSIVDQREVGSDTRSFDAAMRHVLRQSPDVVLIGEVRDQDSVRTALMLAETGHLVLTSIHSGEVTQGISRLVDMFPAEQQAEIRISLSMVLRGMLVQILLPSLAENAARILAYEMCLPNAAVRNLIRSGKFEQIYSQLQTQHQAGMRTMNQSLVELVQKGKLSRDLAMAKTTKAEEFKTMLGYSGSRGPVAVEL